MIYLFEDNKLDVNSKMFISGYSNDISSNFVFWMVTEGSMLQLREF